MKTFNKISEIIKICFLFILIPITFLLVIQLYSKNGRNIIDSMPLLISFVLLFTLFVINFIYKQESVNKNIFYNVTCILVFIFYTFIIYRTFLDKNILIILKTGSKINYDYFITMINPIKILLYGLSISNVLLILTNFKEDK